MIHKPSRKTVRLLVARSQILPGRGRTRPEGVGRTLTPATDQRDAPRLGQQGERRTSGSPQGPGMRGQSALLRGASCRPGCRASFPPSGEARTGFPVHRSPDKGHCGCLYWLSWCLAASPGDKGMWIRPTKSHAVPYRTDQAAYKPSVKGPPHAAVRLGPLRAPASLGDVSRSRVVPRPLGMKGETVESGEIRPGS